MLKYRHPTLGRFERLTFQKGSSLGGVHVPEKVLAGLAGYLTEAKTPSQKRILGILEDMLMLGKIELPVFSETVNGPLMVLRAGRYIPNPQLKKLVPEKYNLQLEIDDRTRALNRKLATYRFCPRVYRAWKYGWLVTWETEREQEAMSEQMKEGEALELILNLARSGYLDRLRRCTECRKWLYAKFRHQNFCSAKCQQRNYTHSEEWKKHRREYMRDYYRRHYQAPQDRGKKVKARR